jgi:dUTP pyrophosphatase
LLKLFLFHSNLFASLPLFTMQNVHIKIVNHSDNEIPSYATPGAAGMDIRANLQEPITLQSLQRQMVPTGLFIELPEGYEAQVRPRSGLANKKGITCLNSPGTVDSDYRGEIKVILINLSDSAQTIEHGDRIAQMIIAKVEKATWELAEQLNETQRGEGGFGHTGFN